MAKAPAQQEEEEGPEPGDTGMEKGVMKILLKRARSEPVNCALAQSDPQSGGLGLILMDKIKQPKQLVRALKEKFPALKTPSFGTASVNPDEDPKLVTFKMNKRIPGMDRRVRKSLKGTGYTKVAIELGTAGEDDDEG